MFCGPQGDHMLSRCWTALVIGSAADHDFKYNLAVWLALIFHSQVNTSLVARQNACRLITVQKLCKTFSPHADILTINGKLSRAQCCTWSKVSMQTPYTSSDHVDCRYQMFRASDCVPDGLCQSMRHQLLDAVDHRALSLSLQPLSLSLSGRHATQSLSTSPGQPQHWLTDWQ